MQKVKLVVFTIKSVSDEGLKLAGQEPNGRCGGQIETKREGKYARVHCPRWRVYAQRRRVVLGLVFCS